MTTKTRPVYSRAALSHDELLASICRDSFFDFFLTFWPVIAPGQKLDVNWHIEYLCWEIQKAAEKVFANEPREYDLDINQPPGTTKSSVASVAFCPWTWTRMPTARHICASYSERPVALKLSQLSRDVTTSELYRRLFPDILLRDDQNAKGQFQNTLGGWRLAVGTGGSVTGMHAHYIVIDDPIDPKSAGRMSGSDLEAANSWMNETIPSRKVDKEIALTILVMQRLHQNDPSGNRKAKARDAPLKSIVLPADLKEGFPVVPKKLKKFYKDGLLDPKRLSRKQLRLEQVILGEYGYAGQYGQAPVPKGGATFKVDAFGAPIGHPPMESLKRVCRFWDKAGTTKRGAWTVGALLGYTLVSDRDDPSGFSKHWYVLDIDRFREDSAKREARIKNKSQSDKLKYGHRFEAGLEQEPGSGGKESAQNTVKRLSGMNVKTDKVSGDKEARADEFSAQVNAGNVELVRGDWNAEYIDELKHFPFSTNKDQVDASSGAFNQLNAERPFVGLF